MKPPRPVRKLHGTPHVPSTRRERLANAFMLVALAVALGAATVMCAYVDWRVP